MTTLDVFAMDTGPYIPPEHLRYNLLPRLRANGGEVFSYPAELDVIDQMVSEHKDEPNSDEHKSRLIPYGMNSYAEYFNLLASYENRYRNPDPDLADTISWLIAAVKRMNVKENWSIVRYLGDQYDGETGPGFGLTKGKCYYWPCSRENPVYEGVIDDEEFTSYLYPCDSDSWQIISDPTGMAARALAGEADTIDEWYPQLAQEPGTFDSEMRKLGVPAKRMKRTPVFNEDVDDSWRASESDPITVRCPGCGAQIQLDAWTLVNARRNPELAELLLDGHLFGFTCPECGYSTNLRFPCLYLDPTHGACIYLVIDGAMSRSAAEMFDGLSSEDSAIGHSRKRIVFERRDLQEKALTFSAGMDDRVIELLKMAVIGFAKQQGAIRADARCDVNLVGTEENELRFRLEADEVALTSELPRDAYAYYASALDESTLFGDQPYAVNRAWAEGAVDVLLEEDLL